ncbi:MAG: AAA family ATPase [Burkholderiales bacterium]|nr:AAA family ATPase [Burkholderiales bacterium]
MLDEKLLNAVDEDAKRYQPPLRKLTADDYQTFEDAGIQQSTIPDGVVLTCGSDLTPEPVRWLWPAWLALGKLHILAGAPGQGKTTIAMALAATVSIAGRWPDGTHSEAGNVLIWSGEDDAADTLLPRLLAAGADRSRCFFISGSRIGGEVQPFDPASDMGQLLAAVEKIGGIKLLVVDPVVNVVTGDSHKNTEVRRAMQPLVDLAAACDCALLGITHFSKGGQGSDPSQRVIGSVAFTAVARVVLVAAKVKGEDGKDTRILARSKSNIGPDDGGFQYHLEQVEVDAFPGIEAARIAWGKAVEGNARELLTDPNEAGEEVTDSNDACDLLKAELSIGTLISAEVACKPLKDAGFSKKQIWAASKKLRVIRKKGGMKEGWQWRLPGPLDVAFTVGFPEDSAEGSEDSSFQNGESSEPSGEMESSEVDVL